MADDGLGCNILLTKDMAKIRRHDAHIGCSYKGNHKRKLHIYVASMSPACGPYLDRCKFIIGRKAKGKVSLWTKVVEKNMSYQIIPALDLTTLWDASFKV